MDYLNTIIIPDQNVATYWVGPMKQYYVDLGYIYTGYRKPLLVNYKDLLKTSHLNVNVICPKCNNARFKMYKTIFQAGHTCCINCVYEMRKEDLTGKRFGRLLVKKSSQNRKGYRYWECECTCGNIVIARMDGLKSGHSKSCGCFKSERASKTHSGKGNVHWNPNLTEKDRINGRTSNENKIWRKAVFERDDYICVICDGNGNLNAHHLYSYADYPEYRYDITNGATVCWSCHMEFHNKYGRKNNTAEQFYEWENKKLVELEF